MNQVYKNAVLDDYRFFKLAYNITQQRIKECERTGVSIPGHLPTRLKGLERIIRSYHTKASEDGGKE